jgi:hypothetical protein
VSLARIDTEVLMGTMIAIVGMNLLPLSWKFYFFGACLFGLCLWERQRRLLETKADQADIGSALLRICRLGIVLTSFAFLIAPRTKWMFVGVPFAMTTLIGWVLGYNAVKRPQMGRSVTTKVSNPGQTLFVVLGSLALGIAAMALPGYGNYVLLAVWGGCAGFLLGLGIHPSFLRRTQFLSREH